MDYYKKLGISKWATPAQIKKAFRTKAKQYHPDVNSTPGTEARFKEVNEAYSVLKDTFKRAAYDRAGSPPKNKPAWKPKPWQPTGAYPPKASKAKANPHRSKESFTSWHKWRFDE